MNTQPVLMLKHKKWLVQVLYQVFDCFEGAVLQKHLQTYRMASIPTSLYTRRRYLHVTMNV